MIDFDKMKKVADLIGAAKDTDAKLDVLRQLKHEFILGLVAFVHTEYADHKKVCDAEDCDWCEAMAFWLDEEVHSLRVEAHANIIINFTVNGHTGIWPGGDKDLEKEIANLVPTIKAQISQGQKEGMVKIQIKPLKDKQH